MCAVALLINVVNACHGETRGGFTKMADGELSPELEVQSFTLDFCH